MYAVPLETVKDGEDTRSNLWDREGWRGYTQYILTLATNFFVSMSIAINPIYHLPFNRHGSLKRNAPVDVVE